MPLDQEGTVEISDFDKLVNNTADDDQAESIATSPVAPSKKAIKKKPVRASLPLKFKVTKVILIII